MLQPLPPRRAPAPEPVIEIHIGRIEVRAQLADAPGKPSASARGGRDGLSDYLNRRARGARS